MATKSDYDRKYYAANRDKRIAYTKQYNRDNPRLRLKYRIQQFGLTLEQYDTMLETQKYCCCICKTSEPGKHNWHVDHNHTTGKVRGLLCSPCNTGLGHFGDDPTRLRAAADYLERDMS